MLVVIYLRRIYFTIHKAQQFTALHRDPVFVIGQGLGGDQGDFVVWRGLIGKIDRHIHVG